MFTLDDVLRCQGDERRGLQCIYILAHAGLRNYAKLLEGCDGDFSELLHWCKASDHQNWPFVEDWLASQDTMEILKQHPELRDDPVKRGLQLILVLASQNVGFAVKFLQGHEGDFSALVRNCSDPSSQNWKNI